MYVFKCRNPAPWDHQKLNETKQSIPKYRKKMGNKPKEESIPKYRKKMGNKPKEGNSASELPCSPCLSPLYSKQKGNCHMAIGGCAGEVSTKTQSIKNKQLRDFSIKKNM